MMGCNSHLTADTATSAVAVAHFDQNEKKCKAGAETNLRPGPEFHNVRASSGLYTMIWNLVQKKVIDS